MVVGLGMCYAVQVVQTTCPYKSMPMSIWSYRCTESRVCDDMNMNRTWVWAESGVAAVAVAARFEQEKQIGNVCSNVEWMLSSHEIHTTTLTPFQPVQNSLMLFFAISTGFAFHPDVLRKARRSNFQRIFNPWKIAVGR